MNCLTDADTLDIVGERKDGGLDLVISAIGPLDGSPETLSLLKGKILNYLAASKSEKFLHHYGRNVGDVVAIFVSCPYFIAPEALTLIEELRKIAAKDGIDVEIRKHMGDVH